MKCHMRLAALLFPLFQPFAVLASACDVPKFETFAPARIKQHDPSLVAVEYMMQPVASLRIPAGFSKMGSASYGTVVLGDHPKGIVAVLGYETREIVSVHKKDTSPAEFMLSIFRGADATGCAYLMGQDLANEDYRLHATLGNGIDLFAYGTAASHHFYVIRKDKPDYVINGQFKNISRSDFEAILATINIQ